MIKTDDRNNIADARRVWTVIDTSSLYASLRSASKPQPHANIYRLLCGIYYIFFVAKVSYIELRWQRSGQRRFLDRSVLPVYKTVNVSKSFTKCSCHQSLSNIIINSISSGCVSCLWFPTACELHVQSEVLACSVGTCDALRLIYDTIIDRVLHQMLHTLISLNTTIFFTVHLNSFINMWHDCEL